MLNENNQAVFTLMQVIHHHHHQSFNNTPDVKKAGFERGRDRNTPGGLEKGITSLDD